MFGAGRPGDQSGDEKPQGGDSSGSSARPSDESSKASDGSVATEGGKARRGSKPSSKVIAIGVVTAAVVAAGVTIAVTHSSSNKPQPSAAGRHARQPAAGPIHVSSILPASHTTGVDGAAPITVQFSADVAPNSPLPLLSPSVAGSWSVAGDFMVFTPSAPFTPSSRVTVEIPAGPTGVRSAAGGLLTTAVTDRFTTGGYTQEALAELLAQQGYLPLSWTPAAAGATRDMNIGDDPASLTPAGEAYDPPAGTFNWAAGYPSSLTRQWSPDQANVILRGAVMAFESEHNMTIDGSLTPRLWKALFRAQELGEQNQNGYTYAIASKQTPETLTIWHDGHYVMRSLANTGIPVSPTVDGTFPVYERFRFQIMRGHNPDGSAYADPVSFVSYFNGGDAVHYFPRGSYGFQQSLGCVELPYNTAEQAFPYLTYGSLVTVSG